MEAGDPGSQCFGPTELPGRILALPLTVGCSRVRMEFENNRRKCQSSQGTGHRTEAAVRSPAFGLAKGKALQEK